jgi:release factor glutamine methyltransferase
MKNKEAVALLSNQFALVSDSARLDAEILLAHILKRSRAWLLAHDDQVLSVDQSQQLLDYAARRIQGEPIAYILGSKEFWGLELTVSNAVLIPRPETEHLVEWILDHFPNKPSLKVLDLGAGSGAISIALAKERGEWFIEATDQSLSTLDLASENAKRHGVTNLHFYHGDWYRPVAGNWYDLIVSNPPYLADQDPHLEQLTFEPYSALVSGKEGTEALQEIIEKAPKHLKPTGYLVLEHGFNQSQKIVSLLEEAGFANIETHLDYSGQTRFVTAQQLSLKLPIA